MTRIFFFCLLMMLCSCSSSFYIVRHAEKTTSDCVAPLATEGFTRALVLRDTLSGKGIDSVFASTCLRTRQTAQPTATAIAQTVQQVQPTDAAAHELVTRLKKIRGKSVLVVGHGNTVPIIVKGLSGRVIAPIEDSDYDNMYIIKCKTFIWTTWSFRHTTYGEPTN